MSQTGEDVKQIATYCMKMKALKPNKNNPAQWNGKSAERMHRSIATDVKQTVDVCFGATKTETTPLLPPPSLPRHITNTYKFARPFQNALHGP